MKIKFIGTGNMLTNTRANTSILIDNILFDIGSGTMRQLELLKIDFTKINYIIISHFHLDHFLDISYFLQKRRLTKNTNIPLTIIAPVSGKQKIIDLLNFLHGDGNPEKYNNLEEKFNIKIVELSNLETFFPSCSYSTPNSNFDSDSDSNSESEFTLTAYTLSHGNCKPINGYLLKKENHTLSYCTDTSYCENFETMCNLSDYIFSDADELESLPMHIGAYELLDISKKHPNRTFFAIHRSNFKDLESPNLLFPKDLDEFTI